MNRFTRWLTGGALLLLTLLLGSAALAQSGEGRVRFVHVVPGAAAFDVYADGQLVASGLDFAGASEYVTMPAGAHDLTLTPAGLTTVVAGPQSVTVSAGAATTLVLSSSNPLTFAAFEESLLPLPLGKARLTAIHAIAGGPDVDVVLSDGTPVFPGLAYNAPAGSFDLDLSFVYELAVLPAGGTVDNALIATQSLALDSGTAYIFVVYGTAARPQTLLLSAPVDAESGSGFVRLVHGLSGGDPVDVFFNDVRVATGMTFNDGGTEYIAVPAGSHEVAVRPSGGDDDLILETIDVAADSYQTLVIASTPGAAVFVRSDDDLSGAADGQAVLTLINGDPGVASATVTLADGTELVAGVAPQDAASAAFDAVSVPATVTLTLANVDGDAGSDLPFSTFYGGVAYTAVVVSGDTGPQVLALNPVGVAQTLSSAPGASAQVVSSGGDAAALATSVPAPTDAAAAQPTSAPALPAATNVPLATGGPTATVVNLDPGANLNLRLYPSSWVPDAQPLHVLPPGTVVRVNGREGAPFFPDGIATATPRPEATPFVDPATALVDKDQDLDPLVTWLNVTFDTPDGGTITGWVSAQYLDVRDANGEKQRLADLPLVPNNRPGEALNTAITPPPPPQNRVTVTVINLNPGANLNIRRSTSVDGEVLAQMPLGTVAGFLGINADRTWVFVSYVTPQGGTVTGWVAVGFVSYQWNGADVKIEELEARELLTIVPDDTRGQVGGASTPAPVVAATPNPARDAFVATVALDPGANLNLRLTPNVQGQVLAQIPSQTQLVVQGRTNDALWLRVTYEGVSGWITADSRYVVLTFNGDFVNVLDVPVSADAPVGTGTPAPTLTPTPTP